MFTGDKQPERAITKRVFFAAAVALTIGLGGGLLAGQSAWARSEIPAGLAIAIGCTLAFCLWVWYRARPGSGDAMVMPELALMLASMWLGVLPGLFWPAAEGIQIAGSIASMIVPAVVVTREIRRRRSARLS